MKFRFHSSNDRYNRGGNRWNRRYDNRGYGRSNRWSN
jgi:hypothetical protein